MKSLQGVLKEKTLKPRRIRRCRRRKNKFCVGYCNWNGNGIYTGAAYINRSYDGVNVTSQSGTWSANEIHRRYVQTSSDGTKLRVGYQRYTSAMVEITSGIQWSNTGAESTWATFDGSFNPLSYLRLGMNLTVQIWGRKLVVANKPLSAAEISDAWGLVA